MVVAELLFVEQVHKHVFISEASSDEARIYQGIHDSRVRTHMGVEVDQLCEVGPVELFVLVEDEQPEDPAVKIRNAEDVAMVVLFDRLGLDERTLNHVLLGMRRHTRTALELVDPHVEHLVGFLEQNDGVLGVVADQN